MKEIVGATVEGALLFALLKRRAGLRSRLSSSARFLFNMLDLQVFMCMAHGRHHNGSGHVNY
jgi:hypothetical protein